MKICWVFVHLITLSYCLAQADSPRVLPDARIARLTLDTQSVAVLHLRPGFVSSVRLPEDVSSVVLGNPGTFKAEHSEAEPAAGIPETNDRKSLRNQRVDHD